MNCKRCRTPMVRFSGPNGSTHTTCGRCCRYVDCAICPKCNVTSCLRCYNKPPPAKAKGPLISGDFTL